MDSSSLLRTFRLQMMDNVGPHYLWTDEDVFDYADQAQKLLCREVRGIADAVTPEVCRVAISAGQAFSPLDPRVLEVRTATLVSQRRPLRPIGTNELDTYRSEQTGIPSGFVVGLSDGFVRWDCVPVVSDVAELAVYRLPLRPITDEGQALEIGDEHKYALLAAMAHFAYLKPDPDAYDRGRSDAAFAQFMTYAAKARRDINKIRSSRKTVAFGGY